MKRLVITLLCLLSLSAYAERAIDERDPALQSTLDALANARAALERAQQEAQRAEANNPIPGLRLDKLVQEIQLLTGKVDYYLTPREYDRRYQTTIPDGIYLTEPFDPYASDNQPLEAPPRSIIQPTDSVEEQLL